MQTPKVSKNKILLIALVIVAIVGYYIFTSGAEDAPLVGVQSGAPGTIGQELVIELNRLKNLQKFNDSMLRDPAFTSLQDFTQAVVVQPLGRNNPLAPIGQ